MVAIPGSEILSASLHVISQSLIIPVIVGLLAFMVYSIIQVGGILSEYSSRKKTDLKEIEDLITNFSNAGTPEGIKEVLNGSNLPSNHKLLLGKIALKGHMGEKSREAFARKLIESEEIKAANSIEKTDIIAKIAPAVGLMGTLIPLGPGLAALGGGDIQLLSQNLLIAFDSAIIGMAAASIAFTISRIRRRWYEDQLSTLDTLAESILEVMNHAQTKTKIAVY